MDLYYGTKLMRDLCKSELSMHFTNLYKVLLIAVFWCFSYLVYLFYLLILLYVHV